MFLMRFSYFSNTSDLQRKNSGLLAKFFRRSYRNSFYVAGPIFWEKVFLEKIFFVLHIFSTFNKIIAVFGWNILSRLWELQPTCSEEHSEEIFIEKDLRKVCWKMGKTFQKFRQKFSLGLPKLHFTYPEEHPEEIFFWNEKSKQAFRRKKYRTFGQKISQGCQSSIKKKQRNNILREKMIFWENVFFKKYFRTQRGKFHIFGANSRQVVKACPEKQFEKSALWTRKQELKLEIKRQFSGFKSKTFVANFKSKIYMSRGAS